MSYNIEVRKIDNFEQERRIEYEARKTNSKVINEINELDEKIKRISLMI